MKNLTPRQHIKYLSNDKQVKTGVIASISELTKKVQISQGDVISFDQIID